MIIVPYSKDNFDDGLKFVINTIKKSIGGKKDDFLLLNCGTRGTGKSTISLHIEDEYLGEESSVDYIGLDPSDFANALKLAKEKDLPRFCNNDEANVNKRDALRSYNKDLLDLYYSIRGLQIFHIWNNPSLEVIDKPFIEDIIKGVIFCISKETKRPRLYYYFRKDDILKIWEKYQHLNIRLLKKVADQYAYYRGWFKDYKGELLEPYNKKKQLRMGEKVDTFHTKYADNTNGFLKRGDMLKKLNISKMTFIKYTNLLIDNKTITEENMIISPTGHRLYNQELIPKYIETIKSNSEDRYANRTKKTKPLEEMD